MKQIKINEIQLIEMNYYDQNNNNVQLVKFQLDALVQCLKLNLKLWRKSHLFGWHHVQAIAKIHSKSFILESNSNLSKLWTQRRLDTAKVKRARLQRELKTLCNTLLKQVEYLEEANERLRASLKPLRKWSKDWALCERVFFRNWTLKQLLKFVEHIMCLYDAEYEIKLMVAEDIATLQSQKELHIFQLAWRYPRHALTVEFDKMFAQFNKETK